MGRVGAAGLVLDKNALDALAGHVGKLVLVDEGDLGKGPLALASWALAAPRVTRRASELH